MSNERKEYLVRIKPQNPRKGLKKGRHMAFGILFDVARGWYKVSEFIVRFNKENQADEKINLIDYLRSVRNDNEDPESPLAFDVCTPDEAKALQAAEKASKEAAIAKAENPNPVDLMASENTNRVSGDHTVTREAPPAKVKRPRGRPPKAPKTVPVADAE